MVPDLPGLNQSGELMDWIPVLALYEYNLDKDDFELYIIEAVPTILNMLDAKMRIKQKPSW